MFPDIIAILERHRLTVKMIVITHAHIDHIGGAEKLRASRARRFTCMKPTALLSDQLDVQAAWLGMETPEDPGIDTPAHEGDMLRAGSIEAHVLHTPGPHSGQHFALPAAGTQTDRGRHAVQRQRRTYRFAGRRLQRRSRDRSAASCTRCRRRPLCIPGHGGDHRSARRNARTRLCVA